MRPPHPPEPPRAYAPHRAYIAPAVTHIAMWRILCVATGFELAFLMTPSVIAALAPSSAALAAYHQATTPLATVWQFLSFGFAGLALVGLVGLFHGRGLASLLGPRDILRRDLSRVFGAVAVVLLVQEPVRLWLDWDAIVQMRDIGQWAIWLLPAMVALLVQVGTEELFFRGYLQQQLAVRSPDRWVWMGLPSIMFGLAHYANGSSGLEGVLWAFWATLLGLACADLTARTGSLGAAIGLHLANNTFALLILSVEGWPTSGLALFLLPYTDPTEFTPPAWLLLHPWGMLQLVLAALSVLVMWLAARLALRR